MARFDRNARLVGASFRLNPAVSQGYDQNRVILNTLYINLMLTPAPVGKAM
jgi:hypothetical protein